jgi:predicted RNA binding protein YcfA (HicA-like mRNA interferase family)
MYRRHDDRMRFCEASDTPTSHSLLCRRQSQRIGRSGIVVDMAVTVQELLKQLAADGWVQVRQKGSHRQFHHPTKPGTVTVAGKASLDIPPGTLNNILKQAGLKK